MENENRQTFYLGVYQDLLQKVGDSEVACSIMQEVGKDSRVEKMSKSGLTQVKQNGTTSDAPASEKQIAFLEKLGVPFKVGITKSEASNLIDENNK